MIEFHVTYASKDEAAAIIRHGNVSANADYARWIEEETKIA